MGDESNMPSVGLEVLYESSNTLIKIKVPSEEEKHTLKNKTLTGKATEKEEGNAGVKEDDITERRLSKDSTIS